MIYVHASVVSDIQYGVELFNGKLDGFFIVVARAWSGKLSVLGNSKALQGAYLMRRRDDQSC
jgi:hypothetical protein